MAGRDGIKRQAGGQLVFSSQSRGPRARRGRTASGDLGALGGELDVDDVAECLLGVFGDANRAETGRVVERDPLVLGRVALGCRIKRNAGSVRCNRWRRNAGPAPAGREGDEKQGGEAGGRDVLTTVRNEGCTRERAQGAKAARATGRRAVRNMVGGVSESVATSRKGGRSKISHAPVDLRGTVSPSEPPLSCQVTRQHHSARSSSSSRLQVLVFPHKRTSCVLRLRASACPFVPPRAHSFFRAPNAGPATRDGPCYTPAPAPPPLLDF
jgi:hypothetical protein